MEKTEFNCDYCEDTGELRVSSPSGNYTEVSLCGDCNAYPKREPTPEQEELFRLHAEYVVEEVKEAVDHPSHYNMGNIEVIDAIEDWYCGVDFHLGNAIKYIARAPHKANFLEDLKKARWYLDRAIQRVEND